MRRCKTGKERKYCGSEVLLWSRVPLQLYPRPQGLGGRVLGVDGGRVAPLRAQTGPGALPRRRCPGRAASTSAIAGATDGATASTSSPRTTGPRSTFPLPAPLHACPGPPLLRRRMGTRPRAPRGGAPRLLCRGAGPGGEGVCVGWQGRRASGKRRRRPGGTRTGSPPRAPCARRLWVPGCTRYRPSPRERRCSEEIL